MERDREEQELIRQATINSVPSSKEHSKNSVGNNSKILLGRTIKDNPVNIQTLREDSGRVAIEGCIFDMESRELRGGKYLITLDVTDYSSSITVKMFLAPDKAKSLLNSLNKDHWYRFRGDCQYDKYQREIVLISTDINTVDSRTRLDNASEKRVELHLHTQMSSLDAVASAKALVERAAMWSHPAVAITDHGVVQAFPEAYNAGKNMELRCYLV